MRGYSKFAVEGNGPDPCLRELGFSKFGDTKK
jgi:hypothetical protein